MQRASVRSDQIAKMKALSVLCFAFWVLFLFGCSPKESDAKGDLTQYMDKARLWAATEAQINNAIASVRRDHFVHDASVAEALKPAVGIARAYVQQLENYRPPPPSLYNVHQEYIEPS